MEVLNAMEALQIPADRRVRLVISLGYAAEGTAHRPKSRKPLGDFVRFL